jgi:hypothetical protein
MRTSRALLPLAVAAGLAAASPADAATHHAPAHLAGGDPPPIVPSLIQTRITRTENALERLTKYVDNNQPDKVVSVGKVIRRQTSAAWRGAKYYLRTAPPPVTDDLAASKPRRVRSFKGGAPAAPVVADQFTSAVAVFSLAHDVSAEAIELTDGAHGNTLAGLSRTLFWTLDKRDVMVQDAKTFEPPAPPDDLRARSARRTVGGAHSRTFKGGAVGGSFAPLMPEVTQGLDDEMQHIDGLRSDATDLDARGKSILRQAETQILFTERTINTIWPPVPADD